MVTSAFKLHDTVLKVSSEAKALIPQMPLVKQERKLLSELILCILSSQEKYEVALGAMKMLQKNNVLFIPQTKLELKDIKRGVALTLCQPVKFTQHGKNYSRRLRFFIKKGKFIINTIKSIYLNNLTIKQILTHNDCIQETRKNIINYSCGLGPKQASMFLRNVGYHSEFAVLDKHVIDYMKILGMSDINAKSYSSMGQYQMIEMRLKSYAETYNVSLLHLDLAIWTTMRTIKKINNA